MEAQLLDVETSSSRIKIVFQLGTEIYSAQANTGLVSEQLMSIKEHSMNILKDFITRHNIPNDIPDEPEEVSSGDDEISVTPPVKKSKKRQ